MIELRFTPFYCPQFFSQNKTDREGGKGGKGRERREGREEGREEGKKEKRKKKFSISQLLSLQREQTSS